MEIVEQLSFGSFIDETTPGKIIRAIYNSLPFVPKDALRLYPANGSDDLIRIRMDTNETIFRPEQTAVTLLAIKEGKKVQYARLAARYAPLLRAAGTLSALFVEMLKYSIGADPFGCCHLCDKCSDAGHCLHEDQLYALVCQYKAHLDAGRVFYGEKGSTK